MWQKLWLKFCLRKQNFVTKMWPQKVMKTNVKFLKTRNEILWWKIVWQEICDENIICDEKICGKKYLWPQTSFIKNVDKNARKNIDRDNGMTIKCKKINISVKNVKQFLTN